MKVDSGGVSLDVQVEGSGPPVLLIHGFPDTKRVWSKVTPALVDAGYQVITYDQRGYGASDKPTEVDDYHILFLAADAGAVLDAVGVEKAHVVGHDWGAAVAWTAAAFAPERVDHLVALSVGNPNTFVESGFPQKEKSWYMLFFQFAPQAEEWLTIDGGANLRAFSQHPDFDATYAELLATGALTPALSYYRANVGPDTFLQPAVVLPPVTVPTMGIWSSDDMALTEIQMSASADSCTNGFRYERIDGVGHWIQLEAPDALNALLLDFLPR